MERIPVIDMTATGINITCLRINAGLTVKDLQDIFGFSTPQAIYKWQRGTALPKTSPNDRAGVVPSTNWSGHRPFKAAMLGSNPAGDLRVGLTGVCVHYEHSGQKNVTVSLCEKEKSR